MPFANKFRAMMELPLHGDTVGDFTVESVDVSDEAGGWRGYGYEVRLVLHGPGGRAGLHRALAPLFSKRAMTFSSYGNPYQLWFGKPEIESLGDRRYAVCVAGAGARIDLAGELERFLGYLAEEDQLAAAPGSAAQVIETYLDRYRHDVTRRVARYRRQLTRHASQTRCAPAGGAH